MSAITPAAFFALAAACAPGLDSRLLLVQAQIESKLDPLVIHHNTNGTTDYGLMQINSANFVLLGIRSTEEALDPCRNIKAAADLYQTLSRYNSGNATTSIGYAARVMAQLSHLPPAVPQEFTPLPAANPPVVYIRPAHAGRNLVYAN